MNLHLRAVADLDDGWEQMVRVDALAFGAEEEPDNDDRGVMELDRAVLAFDGTQPVGCAALFGFDLSVPGGSVQTAGLTWVGVVPTHRRRGVMTALLSDRHTAARAAGEPLVALWASQSAIYPRFGYGVAAHSLRLTIPHSVDLRRAPEAADVELTLLPSGEDAAFTRPVHDRVRRARPGMPALDDRWYARSVADRPAERAGWSPLRTFVALRGDHPLGYARFQQKHDWSRGVGEGTVRVVELVCDDPAGAAALWRQLHALENMARTEAWNVPLDDPVLLWTSEIRDVDMRMREQLYVRVLDVPAALQGRTYRTDVDVVLDVADAAHPDNQRRWRLSAGPSGAVCDPTSDPADLTLDVRALGAALLGSTTLHQLAAAGDVAEHSPGSLDRAGTAFGHGVAAWCPWVF